MKDIKDMKEKNSLERNLFVEIHSIFSVFVSFMSFMVNSDRGVRVKPPQGQSSAGPS